MNVDADGSPDQKRAKFTSNVMSEVSPDKSASNDFNFKIPGLLKPGNLTKNGSQSFKPNPLILENVRALNALSPPQSSKKSNIPGKLKTTKPKKIEMVEYSPDMVAMYEAVADKNSTKMSESVRKSLTDTLYNLFDTENSEEEIGLLRDELTKQKKNYEQLLANLQTQNRELKEQLKKSTEKTLNQNDTLNELNLKCIKLTNELAKARAKNVDLNGTLCSMTTKNSYLTSTITKFQVKNVDLGNNLLNAETKNRQLLGANQNLTDSNIKLTSDINKLAVENRALTKRLNEVLRMRSYYEQYTP